MTWEQWFMASWLAFTLYVATSGVGGRISRLGWRHRDVWHDLSVAAFLLSPAIPLFASGFFDSMFK